MKKCFLFSALLTAVLFIASVDANALTFNPFKRAGRVRAESLIISGNFVYSRLLADLAQYHSKQPVLLISPDVDGSYQLFYLPSSTKASAVNPDEFMEILSYINPKRIIALGGEDFVPHKFIDMARSKYSVLIVDSDDWSRNAETLGGLLNSKKLPLQFNEYKANLDAVNKQ